MKQERNLKSTADRICIVLCLIMIASIATSQDLYLDWVLRRDINGTTNDIVTDSRNNIISIGDFRGVSDFDPGNGEVKETSAGKKDIFLQKISEKGKLIWHYVIGNKEDDIGATLAIDSDDNVYVFGYFSGTLDLDPGPSEYLIEAKTEKDAFVAKLNSDGELQWGKLISTTGASAASLAKIGPDGGMWLLIRSNLNNIRDQHLWKIDVDGKVLQQIVFEDPVAISDYDIDKNGNVFVSGSFTGSCDLDPGVDKWTASYFNRRGAFLVKLNPSGSFQWAKTVGNRNGADIIGMSVLATDKLYFYTYLNGEFDVEINGRLETIDTDGQIELGLFSVNENGDFFQLQRLTTTQAAGGALYGDVKGNMYAIGHVIGTMEVVGFEDSLKVVSNGGVDYYIFRFDSTLAIDFFYGWGSSASDKLSPPYFNRFGELYLSMSHRKAHDADFGQGVYQVEMEKTNGDLEYYLSRYTLGKTVGIHDEHLSNDVSIDLYPVPTDKGVNVRVNQDGSQYSIVVRDKLGRTVNEFLASQNVAYIELPDEPGIYFIEIINGQSRHLRKVIKN